ncbi:MAG TPA: DUF1697 domain-containing protein [Gemmatimonadaceae bacterium]|nr:DUF1697 domain-containing protein [Gemmatimonadaceae bacterium]
MPRYIALLRGVNLGGHTVKMDRLRKLFEEMGFKKVETFIASGNVIFESGSRNAAALEKKIAAHLEKSLGFPAMTFLRTDSELAAVLEHDACSELGTRALYIGFLQEDLSKESHAKLMKHSTKSDQFHATKREIYWVCRTHMSDSPFFRIGIEKAAGVKATVRNVTTVARLVDKYPAK